MSKHPDDYPRLSPLPRLAGAAAGATTALTVLAAVLGAFSSVSSDPWLAPTEQVLDAASGCDALLERRARERCMRTLVASRQRGSADRQLALAPRDMIEPQPAQAASAGAR